MRLSHIQRLTCIASVVLASASSVFAQALATPPSAAGAVIAFRPGSVAAEPLPGAQGIVAQLLQGGHTLYLRAPAIATGMDRAAGLQWVTQCQSLRIQDSGYQVAGTIGNALKQLRIPISQLRVGDHCLAALTSKALDLGIPVIVGEIAPVEQLRQAGRSPAAIKQGIFANVSSGPAAQTNILLVGPGFPPDVAPDPAFATLREGEALVIRNHGGSPGTPLQIIARLTAGQWVSAVNDYRPVAATPATVSAPATVPVTQPAPVPTPPPVAPPVPPPLIDPARELKGIALVRALRAGGYNLYMRHSIATTGADGSLPTIANWWENCAIQRNLSDPGREQSKKVGEALRELAVPLGEVKVSQFCRNKETAKLMGIQTITVTEEINHPVGQRTGGPDVNVTRYKHLAMVPKKGTNTLLISHTQGSAKAQERILSSIAEAEIIVFQPDGSGEAEPVARIPPGDWYLYTTLEWAERAKGEPGDAWKPRRK
jgi:phosphohistidine phosphatase SixA